MNLAAVESTVITYLDSQLKGIKIKRYQGEFDASSADRISFKAPCLFVSFLGAQLESTADQSLSATTKWAGFLVLHQAQKQNKIEKQMLENVLAVLNGSSVGLKALPINLQSFEQILIRQLEKGNLSAWVIRWQHSLNLLVKADD